MDPKELRLFREAYGSIYTPQTEEVVEETPPAEEQASEEESTEENKEDESK